MGMLGRFLRFMFYPVVRPASDAAKLLKTTKESLDALRVRRAAIWAEERERRARSIEQALARRADEGGDGPGFTEAELERPGEIADDGRRFEVTVALHMLSAEDLASRRDGYRRTKWFGLVLAATMVLSALPVMLLSKTILGLLMMPVLAMGAVYGLATAFRAALLQSQIEARRLHSWRTYLARPDLFRHLVS